MFTLEKKKKLAEKIEKITEKKYLLKIKDIIIKNNPELEVTKNNNGLFMKFQSLKNDTYIELEKIINKINRRNFKLSMSAEELIDDKKKSSDSDEKIIMTETLPKCNRDVSKKLRLTNTENQILNRRKYEKELKKNESGDSCEPEIFTDVTSDIFIKKKNK